MGIGSWVLIRFWGTTPPTDSIWFDYLPLVLPLRSLICIQPIPSESMKIHKRNAYESIKSSAPSKDLVPIHCLVDLRIYPGRVKEWEEGRGEEERKALYTHVHDRTLSVVVEA